MLFDWYDQGLRIRLNSPLQTVQKFLWFRMFFKQDDKDSYAMKATTGTDDPSARTNVVQQLFASPDIGGRGSDDEDVMGDSNPANWITEIPDEDVDPEPL